MMKPFVFVIVLFLLSVSLLSHVEAKSGSEYTIINTGIKAGGCWYDDSHFVIVKGQQSAPGQEFEVEGLHYLDPNMPRDLKPISLTPLEPNVQKKVWSVSCQDGNIVFLIPGAKKGSSRLYRLRIGEEPELIVEMRAPRVSLSGQYALGNSHIAVMDGGPLQGVFEGNDDCLLSYAKPDFKTLCWDWWLVMPQALPNFVLSEYRWEGSIKVKEPNGQAKWVPNPAPPVKRSDGTELKLGYLLRDLENRIVQEIPTKQGLYKIARNFKPNPSGSFLYALCSKVDDYNPPMTFYGRVCRFKLAGIDTQWEEVFSLQKVPNERASLDDLDVNEQGDVVVRRRANRANPTLWKYTARRASVEQLPITQLSQEVGGVQLTPDGQTISYVDKGRLIFVRSHGGKP
jgi:hypothetical protein